MTDFKQEFKDFKVRDSQSSNTLSFRGFRPRSPPGLPHPAPSRFIFSHLQTQFSGLIKAVFLQSA